MITVEPHTAGPAGQRSTWRAVGMPAEHGGWGLTLEPVLLGLLVAPSWAGAAIGAAAFLAFLVRTPLKLTLVDRHRNRWLARSRAAAVLAAGELGAIVALTIAATARAGWEWWWPVLVAAPLVATELWFDMRSRSRRLIPELCGAVGISAAAASIAVAGGQSTRLAVALWLILAARSVGAIPCIRAQIIRLRRGQTLTSGADLAQLGSIAMAGLAVVVERAVAFGAFAVLALAALQVWWVRQSPPPAKVIGIRQMGLGLGLVAITALGVAVA